MSAELGSMLVKAGKITEAQLTRALEIQKNSKEKLATILVKIGALGDEDDVSEFIGRQLNMGTLRLADIELNPDVVKLIPLDIARKFNVIAISKLGKTLVVALPGSPGGVKDGLKVLAEVLPHALQVMKGGGH